MVSILTDLPATTNTQTDRDRDTHTDRHRDTHRYQLMVSIRQIQTHRQTETDRDT